MALLEDTPDSLGGEFLTSSPSADGDVHDCLKRILSGVYDRIELGPTLMVFNRNGPLGSRGIPFPIKKNRVYLFSGESGSGKTTAVRSCIEDPIFPKLEAVLSDLGNRPMKRSDGSMMNADSSRMTKSITLDEDGLICGLKISMLETYPDDYDFRRFERPGEEPGSYPIDIKTSLKDLDLDKLAARNVKIDHRAKANLIQGCQDLAGIWENPTSYLKRRGEESFTVREVRRLQTVVASAILNIISRFLERDGGSVTLIDMFGQENTAENNAFTHVINTLNDVGQAVGSVRLNESPLVSFNLIPPLKSNLKLLTKNIQLMTCVGRSEDSGVLGALENLERNQLGRPSSNILGALKDKIGLTEGFNKKGISELIGLVRPETFYLDYSCHSTQVEYESDEFSSGNFRPSKSKGWAVVEKDPDLKHLLSFVDRKTVSRQAVYNLEEMLKVTNRVICIKPFHTAKAPKSTDYRSTIQTNYEPDRVDEQLRQYGYEWLESLYRSENRMVRVWSSEEEAVKMEETFGVCRTGTMTLSNQNLLCRQLVLYTTGVDKATVIDPKGGREQSLKEWIDEVKKGFQPFEELKDLMTALSPYYHPANRALEISAPLEPIDENLKGKNPQEREKLLMDWMAHLKRMNSRLEAQAAECKRQSERMVLEKDRLQAESIKMEAEMKDKMSHANKARIDAIDKARYSEELVAAKALLLEERANLLKFAVDCKLRSSEIVLIGGVRGLWDQELDTYLPTVESEIDFKPGDRVDYLRVVVNGSDKCAKVWNVIHSSDSSEGEKEVNDFQKRLGFTVPRLGNDDLLTFNSALRFGEFGGEELKEPPETKESISLRNRREMEAIESRSSRYPVPTTCLNFVSSRGEDFNWAEMEDADADIIEPVRVSEVPELQSGGAEALLASGLCDKKDLESDDDDQGQVVNATKSGSDAWDSASDASEIDSIGFGDLDKIIEKELAEGSGGVLETMIGGGRSMVEGWGLHDNAGEIMRPDDDGVAAARELFTLLQGGMAGSDDKLGQQEEEVEDQKEDDADEFLLEGQSDFFEEFAFMKSFPPSNSKKEFTYYKPDLDEGRPSRAKLRICTPLSKYPGIYLEADDGSDRVKVGDSTWVKRELGGVNPDDILIDISIDGILEYTDNLAEQSELKSLTHGWSEFYHGCCMCLLARAFKEQGLRARVEPREKVGVDLEVCFGDFTLDIDVKGSLKYHGDLNADYIVSKYLTLRYFKYPDERYCKMDLLSQHEDRGSVHGMEGSVFEQPAGLYSEYTPTMVEFIERMNGGQLETCKNWAKEVLRLEADETLTRKATLSIDHSELKEKWQEVESQYEGEVGRVVGSSSNKLPYCSKFRCLPKIFKSDLYDNERVMEDKHKEVFCKCGTRGEECLFCKHMAATREPYTKRLRNYYSCGDDPQVDDSKYRVLSADDRVKLLRKLTNGVYGKRSIADEAYNNGDLGPMEKLVSSFDVIKAARLQSNLLGKIRGNSGSTYDPYLGVGVKWSVDKNDRGSRSLRIRARYFSPFPPGQEWLEGRWAQTKNSMGDRVYMSPTFAVNAYDCDYALRLPHCINNMAVAIVSKKQSVTRAFEQLGAVMRLGNVMLYSNWVTTKLFGDSRFSTILHFFKSGEPYALLLKMLAERPVAPDGSPLPLSISNCRLYDLMRIFSNEEKDVKKSPLFGFTLGNMACEKGATKLMSWHTRGVANKVRCLEKVSKLIIREFNYKDLIKGWYDKQDRLLKECMRGRARFEDFLELYRDRRYVGDGLKEEDAMDRLNLLFSIGISQPVALDTVDNMVSGRKRVSITLKYLFSNQRSACVIPKSKWPSESIHKQEGDMPYYEVSSKSVHDELCRVIEGCKHKVSGFKTLMLSLLCSEGDNGTGCYHNILKLFDKDAKDGDREISIQRIISRIVQYFSEQIMSFSCMAEEQEVDMMGGKGKMKIFTSKASETLKSGGKCLGEDKAFFCGRNVPEFMGVWVYAILRSAQIQGGETNNSMYSAISCLLADRTRWVAVDGDVFRLLVGDTTYGAANINTLVRSGRGVPYEEVSSLKTRREPCMYKLSGHMMQGIRAFTGGILSTVATLGISRLLDELSGWRYENKYWVLTTSDDCVTGMNRIETDGWRTSGKHQRAFHRTRLRPYKELMMMNSERKECFSFGGVEFNGIAVTGGGAISEHATIEAYEFLNLTGQTIIEDLFDACAKASAMVKSHGMGTDSVYRHYMGYLVMIRQKYLVDDELFSRLKDLGLVKATTMDVLENDYSKNIYCVNAAIHLKEEFVERMKEKRTKSQAAQLEATMERIERECKSFGYNFIIPDGEVERQVEQGKISMTRMLTCCSMVDSKKFGDRKERGTPVTCHSDIVREVSSQIIISRKSTNKASKFTVRRSSLAKILSHSRKVVELMEKHGRFEEFSRFSTDYCAMDETQQLVSDASKKSTITTTVKIRALRDLTPCYMGTITQRGVEMDCRKIETFMKSGIESRDRITEVERSISEPTRARLAKLRETVAERWTRDGFRVWCMNGRPGILYDPGTSIWAPQRFPKMMTMRISVYPQASKSRYKLSAYDHEGISYTNVKNIPFTDTSRDWYKEACERHETNLLMATFTMMNSGSVYALAFDLEDVPYVANIGDGKSSVITGNGLFYCPPNNDMYSDPTWELYSKPRRANIQGIHGTLAQVRNYEDWLFSSDATPWVIMKGVLEAVTKSGYPDFMKAYVPKSGQIMHDSRREVIKVRGDVDIKKAYNSRLYRLEMAQSCQERSEVTFVGSPQGLLTRFPSSADYRVDVLSVSRELRVIMDVYARKRLVTIEEGFEQRDELGSRRGPVRRRRRKRETEYLEIDPEVARSSAVSSSQIP